MQYHALDPPNQTKPNQPLLACNPNILQILIQNVCKNTLLACKVHVNESGHFEIIQMECIPYYLFRRIFLFAFFFIFHMCILTRDSIWMQCNFIYTQYAFFSIRFMHEICLAIQIYWNSSEKRKLKKWTEMTCFILLNSWSFFSDPMQLLMMVKPSFSSSSSSGICNTLSMCVCFIKTVFMCYCTCTHSQYI